MNKFELMALPYAPNALEPVISHETIGFHHGKHLAGYVNNLNALVPGTQCEKCGDGVDLEPDCDSLVLIGVEFCDSDLSCELLCDLIDDRAHPPARTTPGCPAVDDCYLVALYELIECTLVKFGHHSIH